jgi:hypothetical protein
VFIRGFLYWTLRFASQPTCNSPQPLHSIAVHCTLLHLIAAIAPEKNVQLPSVFDVRLSTLDAHGCASVSPWLSSGFASSQIKAAPFRRSSQFKPIQAKKTYARITDTDYR